MGSLWYHGHTICVSQGLTLSTARQIVMFYRHLDDVDAPARVESSVGCVVRVEVGWKVLDKVVGVLLLVIELVVPLIKGCN